MRMVLVCISIKHKGSLCITQTKIIKYRKFGDSCCIFVTQSRCDNLVFTSRSLLPSPPVSNTPGKDNMYDNPKTAFKQHCILCQTSCYTTYICSTYVQYDD